MSEIDPEALRRFGDHVDFGKTADDYATHRAGFPPEFFEAMEARGYLLKDQNAVDIGTGTGTIARGLARRGLRVTAVDPAKDLLAEAARVDLETGVKVTYRPGAAEETGLQDLSADLVTAGQCWRWFDRPRAAQEAMRLLVPGGRILIAHFDWVPLTGSLVAATEALILRHNPEWAGARGSGLYPAWLGDLSDAGFDCIETASFDVLQSYSHIAWRGRIRASAGIAASLPADAVAEFDAELAALLECYFPDDPTEVPHRVWWVTALKA